MLWPFHFRNWARRGVAVTPEILEFELVTMREVPDAPMADSKYRAIAHKDFMELGQQYLRKYGPYKSNIRDCDKFTAFYLADIMWGWADCSGGDEALAFGFMEGKVRIPPCGTTPEKITGHRWVWQRDDQGKYWYLHAENNAPMEWEILEIYGARG